MDGRKLLAFPLVPNRLGEKGENSEGILDRPGLTTLLWGKEEQEGMGWGDLLGMIPFYLARTLQAKFN